jgi:hypothetical protein
MDTQIFVLALLCLAWLMLAYTATRLSRADQKDPNALTKATVAVLFSGLSLTILGLVLGNLQGYKQGQIDALHNKFSYQIQVIPDTTYIKKPK